MKILIFAALVSVLSAEPEDAYEGYARGVQDRVNYTQKVWAEIRMDVLRRVGKPFLHPPRLFVLPEPAFSVMACRTGPAFCSIVGATFANGVMVINVSKVDLNTILGQTILVHELVHVTQVFAPGRDTCFKNEREAYTIANLWANAKGLYIANPTDAQIRKWCENFQLTKAN